jgi:chemotaxis protein CheD
MSSEVQTSKSKTLHIRLSDMKLSKSEEELLCATHLGTDLGISIFDREAKVGGMFHPMLPDSTVFPDMAKKNPFIFVDTGLTAMLEQARALGADQQRMEVCMAGGADFMGKKLGLFSVGAQNIAKAMEILKKTGVKVSQQSVGGNLMRSLYLNIGTGMGRIENSDEEREAC